MSTIFSTVKNNKLTTLAAAISNSATSIDVVSATALGLPSLSGGNFAHVVLITAESWRKNPQTTPETFEVIKVTAVSIGGGAGGSDRLTATRGQDNTSGTAFSQGDIVEMRPCAKHFDELSAAINAAGDPVTLAGENYLSIAAQVITAASVNLSGTHVTGTLAAARFPALTGDVTTSAGSLATTIANLSVTNAKIANATIDLTTKVTGILPGANGGTGVANTSKTITLGGNLVTSGAFATTLTVTADTNVTLPTSGTLVNTAVTTLSSLVSVGTITTGVWSATAIGVTKGGTGLTGITANRILYGTATDTIGTSSALTFDGSTLLISASAGVVSVTSTTPSYVYIESDLLGGSGNAIWSTRATAGVFEIRLFSDDLGTSNAALTISRSGASVGTVTINGTVALGTALAVTSGGTGLSSLTADRIPYATGSNTLGTSANFTFNGTTLTLGSTQALTVASDTDASTILGRFRCDARTTDVMSISHFDQTGTNSFALESNAAGRTKLNSASGQECRICVNNAAIITVTSTTTTLAAATITLSSASTDTIPCVGRLLHRSVTDAGPMTATPGTQREIVFNTSDSKFYGCTVTHATAATWVALH